MHNMIAVPFLPSILNLNLNSMRLFCVACVLQCWISIEQDWLFCMCCCLLAEILNLNQTRLMISMFCVCFYWFLQFTISVKRDWFFFFVLLALFNSQSQPNETDVFPWLLSSILNLNRMRQCFCCVRFLSPILNLNQTRQIVFFVCFCFVFIACFNSKSQSHETCVF